MSKLKFASGSLQQFLSIKYASKLSGAGSKVADDVEGTLYKFIPPGMRVAHRFVVGTSLMTFPRLPKKRDRVPKARRKGRYELPTHRQQDWVVCASSRVRS